MNQPLAPGLEGKTTRRRGFAGSGFEKPPGWWLGWSSCLHPRRWKDAEGFAFQRLKRCRVGLTRRRHSSVQH